MRNRIVALLVGALFSSAVFAGEDRSATVEFLVGVGNSHPMKGFAVRVGRDNTEMHVAHWFGERKDTAIGVGQSARTEGDGQEDNRTAAVSGTVGVAYLVNGGFKPYFRVGANRDVRTDGEGELEVSYNRYGVRNYEQFIGVGYRANDRVKNAGPVNGAEAQTLPEEPSAENPADETPSDETPASDTPAADETPSDEQTADDTNDQPSDEQPPAQDDQPSDENPEPPVQDEPSDDQPQDDGNNGHGNDDDGVDESNPGNGGLSNDNPPTQDDDGNNGHGNDDDHHDESNPGNGGDIDPPAQNDDTQPPTQDDTPSDDDGNNGHGNDDDGVDESNPGNGNGNGPKGCNESDSNKGHGNDCDRHDEDNPGNGHGKGPKPKK